MQGKSEFTHDEYDTIKDLLHERGRADRDRQKAIRGKMRKIGFYISDFGEAGFTIGDLDDCIKLGRIKIAD